MCGIGPGITFALDLLGGSPAVRVGLVPCAVGGTALAEWQPGSSCYDNMVPLPTNIKPEVALQGSDQNKRSQQPCCSCSGPARR